MKICMLGAGYVGLVSGACFSDLGNIVVCADVDKKKIDILNSGKIPIYEPGLNELVKKNFEQKRLSFTTDISSSIKSSDIIFICVGTPTKKNSNTANLKYIFQVAKVISMNINKYKVIVTKSTIPVTTGDTIEKIIKKKNKLNRFDVVSNPEFLREGEAIRDFVYPDRVIVGTDSKKANKIMKSLYLPIIKKEGRYINTTRRSAEMIKYASNAFLATKISYINELANLCEKTSVDIKDIALGMGLDKRIGDRFLRAGPAYGGSCFPKDTRALVDTGSKFKINLSIVKNVINSNEKRKKILLKRIHDILGKNIKNKKIAFLGVTFKPNTDDMREATSLKMIPYLSKKGAIINYTDPTGIKNFFKKFKNVKFYKNISSACYKSDLVIIHTEWNDYKQLDFKKIINKANFKIYDMRNLYSPQKMLKDKIKYFGIGR
jgi:UDPglucose 6-dehydrogenase|tara:strand:+ start:2878 stop:4176 length:1299 start_codon:yes stop_codon:yes gene_type:complete